MDTDKDESWWREQNVEDLVRNKIPILIKLKKITPHNINKLIVPYLGNDYNKLNKDIDRNIYLLSRILTDNQTEKFHLDFIRSYVKKNLIKQVDKLSKLIQSETFISDPYHLDINLNNQFEIIFVRHGIACHNVIPKEKKYIVHEEYFDPELTKTGIQRSIELFPALNKKISIYFENNPFSIIASSLIRTQQTAYYMLASHINKSINVAPHIAERNMNVTNMPLSKDEQHKVLNKIDPNIVKFLKKGKDASSIEDIYTKSYPEMFYNWANLNTDFFEKGKDNIFRAVVFTHGGYIDTMFKTYSQNNDIVHVSIDKDNYKKPSFDFTRVKPLNDEYNDCPNDCRISLC